MTARPPQRSAMTRWISGALLLGGCFVAGPSVWSQAPDSPDASRSNAEKPAEKEASVPQAPLPDLLAELSSDDFARRSKAQADILRIGQPVLPSLEKLLQDAPLDTAVRVFQVVELLSSSSDDLLSLEAEGVLERLATGGRPSLAFRAQETLQVTLAPQRRKRAIRQLQTFGATLIPATEFDFVPPGQRQEQPLDDALIASLVLGKKWTGGIENLKLLSFLPELREVQYTASLPIDEMEFLKALDQYTQAARLKRPPAYLGVRGLSQQPCIISQVVKGSPADVGGMKDQDLILVLEGLPIETFDQFRGNLGQFAPASAVELVVLRPKQGVQLENLNEEVLRPGGRRSLSELGEILELEVTLGDW